MEHSSFRLSSCKYSLIYRQCHPSLENIAIFGNSCAWIASVIFALHPVHVESVAWIVELKDVLSTLFYFLSFLSYFHFDRGKNRRFYILSLIFLVLSMLSKPLAISLPLVILLVLWWKKERLEKSDWLSILPFFLIVILLAGMDLFFYHQRNTEDISLSLAQKFIVVGWNVWFYIEKLIWPHPLMTIYPKWDINTHSLWQYSFSGSILIIISALWFLRYRLGKSPLVTVLFFFITLAPTLGFMTFGFMIYSFVADRFQYIPSIAPIVACTAYITNNRKHIFPVQQWIFIPGTIVLLAFLGTLTWRQASTYQDMETLFSDNLKKNPKAWLAHSNLADTYAYQGKYQEAVRHYSLALQYCPQPEKIYIAFGNAYVHLKEYNKAMEQYNIALQIHPVNAVVSNNIGVIAANQGKLNDAQTCYLKALEINPSLSIAYANLGLIKIAQDKYAEAQDYFLQALTINSELACAHCNLGSLLARQRKIEEAIAHFSRATRIKKDYAVANSNLEKAIAAYKQKLTVLLLPFDIQPQTAS